MDRYVVCVPTVDYQKAVRIAKDLRLNGNTETSPVNIRRIDYDIQEELKAGPRERWNTDRFKRRFYPLDEDCYFPVEWCE